MFNMSLTKEFPHWAVYTVCGPRSKQVAKEPDVNFIRKPHIPEDQGRCRVVRAEQLKP